MTMIAPSAKTAVAPENATARPRPASAPSKGTSTSQNVNGDESPDVSTLRSAISTANRTSDAASRRCNGMGARAARASAIGRDKAGKGEDFDEVGTADKGEVAERQHDAEAALDALRPDEMAPGDRGAIAVGKFHQ